MVTICYAYKCNTRHGEIMGRRFYKIPAEKETSDKWISALKRGQSINKRHKRWDAKGSHWRVFSDHFVGGM